jgi:uncharacterized protein YegP (UPF0339 family)
MVIEYFKGPSGVWFVRILARNGETVLVSEAYASKANAKRAALGLLTRINENRRIGRDVVLREARAE